MKGAYCTWWDVPLKDVAEWQQEQCEENEKHCEGCAERTDAEEGAENNGR